MIKRTLTIAGAIAALISFSSCGTVNGIGKDLQDLGNGVQKSANN